MNHNVHIEKFNICSYNFTKLIMKHVPLSNMIDNTYVYSELKKSMDKNFLIEQFVKHMLIYKPLIDNYDDSFIYNDEIQNKLKSEKTIFANIAYVRIVWGTLDTKKRREIFDNLRLLCKYSQRYFMDKYY